MDNLTINSAYENVNVTIQPPVSRSEIFPHDFKKDKPANHISISSPKPTYKVPRIDNYQNYNPVS